MSRTIGFYDHQGMLLASLAGALSIGPIHRPNGAPTMVIKANGLIVARAEDVDGLRWVVERARVNVRDQIRVDRASLGDSRHSFAASTLEVFDDD